MYVCMCILSLLSVGFCRPTARCKFQERTKTFSFSPFVLFLSTDSEQKRIWQRLPPCLPKQPFPVTAGQHLSRRDWAKHRSLFSHLIGKTLLRMHIAATDFFFFIIHSSTEINHQYAHNSHRHISSFATVLRQAISMYATVTGIFLHLLQY